MSSFFIYSFFIYSVLFSVSVVFCCKELFHRKFDRVAMWVIIVMYISIGLLDHMGYAIMLDGEMLPP